MSKVSDIHKSGSRGEGDDNRIDFDEFQSPLLRLLQQAITTQEKELSLQGTLSNIEVNVSQAALREVQNNNKYLEDLANKLKGLTGSKLAVANAAYQTAQTKVSSDNQNYNNVVSKVNTMITSLSQTAAQNLQFANIVKENQDSQNSLIMQWAS